MRNWVAASRLSAGREIPRVPGGAGYFLQQCDRVRVTVGDCQTFDEDDVDGPVEETS
jgi:hypothetical protein